MNTIENHLNILYNKLLTKTDYNFLNSIKDFFPSNNPYFLVCLAEVIYNHLDNEDENVNNRIIFEDYLEYLIEEATILYQAIDISKYFNDIVIV